MQKCKINSCEINGQFIVSFSSAKMAERSEAKSAQRGFASKKLKIKKRHILTQILALRF